MLLNILIYFLILLYIPFRSLTSYEFKEIKEKVLLIKEILFILFCGFFILYYKNFILLTFVIIYLFLFLDKKKNFILKFLILCFSLGIFYNILNISFLIILNIIIMLSFIKKDKKKEFIILNYGFLVFLVGYLIKYFVM